MAEKLMTYSHIVALQIYNDPTGDWKKMKEIGPLDKPFPNDSFSAGIAFDSLEVLLAKVKETFGNGVVYLRFSISREQYPIRIEFFDDLPEVLAVALIAPNLNVDTRKEASQ